MMNPTHTAAWELPLAAWAEWPGETGTELPKLDFVDPMLRRRLSALSRISLWAAQQCAQDLGNVRMIYASQHGEIVRTTEMLEALVAGEPLSPAAFSMSVLNASIGLYSIIRGNTAPATAIAAGDETFGYALLEAYGQLRSNPGQAVLLIYADETVPEVWAAEHTAAPHAVALLLHDRAATRIQCSRAPQAQAGASDTTQAAAFVGCLKAGTASHWSNAANQWQWQRRAA